MNARSSSKKVPGSLEKFPAAKPLRLPTGKAKAKSKPDFGGSPGSGVEFRKILVPVDFSKTSIAAVRYAIDFATLHSSQLILLYVVEPVVGPPGEIGYPGIALSPVPNDYRAVMLKRLERLKNQEVRPGMKVDMKVRVGQAYNEIARAAQELKADLIIIATHGRTGLKHVFLGSTAERVVRHAACPVLTVRKKA